MSPVVLKRYYRKQSLKREVLVNIVFAKGNLSISYLCSFCQVRNQLKHCSLLGLASRVVV